MGRGASAYERELKQILSGESSSAAAVPATPTAPFLVVRSAGSFGFDLVALRPEFAFPIEVKASRSEAIHFSAASGRAAQQLVEHRRAVDRVGLLALYAYRRLGRPGPEAWRLFAPPTPPGHGRLELLRKRLPVIENTAAGNAVLRWESGLPLPRFLDLVGQLTERPARS